MSGREGNAMRFRIMVSVAALSISVTAGYAASQTAANMLASPESFVSIANTDVRSAASAGGWKEIVIGVRPESLELASDGIAAEVEVVEDIGADAFVFCAAEIGGVATKLVARAGAKRAPARGERVTLRPVAGDAHVFDAVG